MSSQCVSYITGRGGSLEHGLGAHLAQAYGVVGGLSLSADWFRSSHFNRSFRTEVLDANIFSSLGQVRELAWAWLLS